jgi:uncharacterized membrane protein YsdA (DUF1294 family)
MTPPYFTNPQFIFLAYLLVINLITVVIFAFDKSRSRGDGRRISEKTLLLFALIGGTPAALYAMNLFRHKTQKYSFQIPLYLIMLAQIGLIVWILRHFSIV